MKTPQHLEKAAKEVKSVAAKREIGVARTAIRQLAAEMKAFDRDETTIREAMEALASTGRHDNTRKKLRAMLKQCTGSAYRVNHISTSDCL